MNTPELKIYAIIVTYNGMHWIDKCLQSIRQSTIPVHTVVIDNLSTDETGKYVIANYPEVEFIQSNINLGFGKGNNLGLRKAINNNADYVFLLNQDAWIEPDTIEKLVAAHKANPEFGVISPFHYNYNKTEIEYYFSTIINPFDCPGFLNDMFFDKFKPIYEIKFVHAACWLISKDCLHVVGGFDPIFHLYSEDNDYINRVKYFKFKVGVCPEAFVMHKGTHKGLTEIDTNFNIKLNLVHLHLKNIDYKLSGLFLTNLKGITDRITSAILYRKLTDLNIVVKLFYFSFRNLYKIYKARKICKKKGAYLNI